MTGYVDPRYAAVRDRAVRTLVYGLPSLTPLSLDQILAPDHALDFQYLLSLALSMARNELIGPDPGLPGDLELAAKEVPIKIAAWKAKRALWIASNYNGVFADGF